MDETEKRRYLAGNSVGIIEGLEMAALYHDGIANRHAGAAVWDESDSPVNGDALAVEAHKSHARTIRKMKPDNKSHLDRL